METIGEGVFVVVAELTHHNVKALLTKPGDPKSIAVYRNDADAELCAAHWRSRVPMGKVRVIPSGDL